jgi:hypothetical protein
MHPHRMDDWGGVKHLWATTHEQPRVFNTQAKARDTPIALVAGRCIVSSRCLRLASAPPWEHHPPLIR